MDIRRSNVPTLLVGGFITLIFATLLILSARLFSDVLASIWPLFLMMVGMALLTVAVLSDVPAHRPLFVSWGSAILLVALLFLATVLELGISWGDHLRLWAVYPLILGVSLMVGYAASGLQAHRYGEWGAIITVGSLLLLGLAGGGVLTPFVSGAVAALPNSWVWHALDFADRWWPLLLAFSGAAVMVLALGGRFGRGAARLVLAGIGGLVALVSLLILSLQSGTLGWRS